MLGNNKNLEVEMTVPTLAPKSPERVISDATPSVAVPKSTPSIDVVNSSAESLWAIIKLQPVKHFLGLVGGLISFLGITFASGYQVGSKIADIKNENNLTRLEGNSKAEASNAKSASDSVISDLKVQIAGLSAKVSANESVIGAMKEELRRRDTESLTSQGTIRALQESLADKERKLVTAQGCAAIRAESKDLMARGEKLQIERIGAQWQRQMEIDAETRVVDARLNMQKSQLDACAAR